MRQLRLRDLFAIITIAALLTAWLQAHRRAADVEAAMSKQLSAVNKQLRATEAVLSRDRNYLDLTVLSFERQLADLGSDAITAARQEGSWFEGYDYVSQTRS